MWIFKVLKQQNEKIADLEREVKGLKEILAMHMDEHSESVEELKGIINSLKDYVEIGNEQTL